MSKELDEFYKKYSARIIAMDDTPLVKVMDGGKFKLLSIEEYDNLKQQLADAEKHIVELEEHDEIYHNQLAIEQLELIKEKAMEQQSYGWGVKYKDRYDILIDIDNQIKQLKEGK